jgi:hypothetical protein
MRAALNSLAVVAPDWLRAHSQSEWVERYGPRSEDSRSPVGEAAREGFAEDIGRQGRELLDALFDPTAPEWLRQVPAVQRLRQVWVQNYYRVEEAVRWRSSENIPPPSRYIGSPYDQEAHYSKKRSTTWVGYKVHLRDRCEPHLPLLITHVETTSAPGVWITIIITPFSTPHRMQGSKLFSIGEWIKSSSWKSSSLSVTQRQTGWRTNSVQVVFQCLARLCVLVRPQAA